MKVAVLYQGEEQSVPADELVVLTDDGIPILIITKKSKGVYELASARDPNFQELLDALQLNVRITRVQE